ncbi:LANO_0G18008g1_1 [Lachancea nothofagi CBS 11611]|uniref:LANO_0G18008g1_1 n=1 Tax=Lachancea nothofagi CBS 11611 TaxID=1266666 RepID=A0A1G4KKI8_9SACH|nr:LANO_0G18008g1_1 [Lachancea nothofagi CBS 11611]
MSSIFGSSNTNSEGRFSNLMVNLPQQQLQQQQSNSAFPHQQQVHAPTLVGSGSAGQAYEQNSDNSKTSWFNNPRKRTIPQSIVKRSAKAGPSDNSNGSGNSGTTSATNGNGFGAMTFGTRKSPNSFNPTKKTHESKDSLPNAILIDSNETPPTKSIFDWQREDEFGSMVPTQRHDAHLPDTPFGSSKVADASMLRNVFDKDSKFDTLSQDSSSSQNGMTGPSLSQRSESAVIVFGYPESISNQIIIQFSKFGNILEDFEALRGASGINAATLRLRNKRANGVHRKYPIFTGDGWIKLTYDSPSSALRALQENGVVYGGCLIGCVPYNKSAVEQLASCTIEKNDDVGGFNLPTNTGSNIGLGGMSTICEPRTELHNLDKNSEFYLKTQRIDMRDGKALFVNNGPRTANGPNFLKNIESKMQDHQDDSQRPNGVMGKVNNWLFGWNDL